MLVVATMDATVSKIGTARMIDTSFSITNFILGLGEGKGKYTGEQLQSFDTSSVIPWLTFAVTA